MSELISQIESDRQRVRREVLIRRILDGLIGTIQLRGLTPETPVDDVRVDFTDASAAFIAPLADAIDILESIIFASDGCVGHRQCAHSMEPWQRARALLRPKWEAATDGRSWPACESVAHAGRSETPRS